MGATFTSHATGWRRMTSDVGATFTSHATCRRRQHVFQNFAMDADDTCNHVENEASGEDYESTDEDPTESKTQTTVILTTWKPPRVETQSDLQLHFEDDYRRQCEQWKRADIRGSTNRLRQNQQVRDVVVNASRIDMRPFWVSQIWATGTMSPCTSRRTSRENRNLGYSSIQQMEKLFREAKVSDEANEALKHSSCNRLKQRAARRQVAIVRRRDVQ